MASRKWFTRSMALVLAAAVGGGAYWLYQWFRPELIRRELVRHIADRFNDVDVEVRDARVRLYGGIDVTDLRLYRRSDPDRRPFLQVPSAVLYHDKEKLNNGKLVVRKVEFFRPRLRIERGVDGKWSFDDLLKPSRDDGPAPMFVMHDATIVFVDRKLGERPVAEWTDVQLTVVNDPPQVVTLSVRGVGTPTGPFTLDGKWDERSGFGGKLDLPAIAVGPDLARVADSLVPEAADYLRPLTGNASAHLDLVWQSGRQAGFHHDLKVSLRDGRYEHPNLPLPLEHIEVDLRSKNGDITVSRAVARSGPGNISVKLDLPREAPSKETLPLTPPGSSAADERDPLQQFEDRLRSLEVALTDFTVSPELFGKLPGKLHSLEEMFHPAGPLNIGYVFKRNGTEWSKRLEVQPLGMAARYRGFPYPLKNVRGTVEHVVTSASRDQIRIDLTGEGAGAAVNLTGFIRGTAPEVDIDLKLTGNGVTLDDELIDAMPDDNPRFLRQLRATAHGDFVANIRHNRRTRRDFGPDAYDNEFHIQIRRGSMHYEVFPYRLENLSGTLVVRTVPDHPTRLPEAKGLPKQPAIPEGTTLEFNDFRATHGGGRLRGSGRKDPVNGGAILTLNVDAEDMALDTELRKALAAIRLDNAWTTFDPSGRMNFAVRAKLFARNDPESPIYPPEDLEMGLAFAGPALRPSFFPYLLTDAAGQVTYAKGRIELKNFRARHGDSELTLPSTEVLFRPSGGYWAEIRDLKLHPLKIDDDFLRALPPGIRAGCEGLELTGPMFLHATRIVVDEQPGPYLPRDLPGTARGAAPEDDAPVPLPRLRSLPIPGPRHVVPTIYWDGSVTFTGGGMKTGVPWENVHGKFASWGLYKGERLGPVRGNILFDRATIAKQPVEAISAQLRVDPRQPDVLQIPAIRARMYGGDVGGEAWVVLDSPARYALNLNAARIRLGDIASRYQLPPKAHLEGMANVQLYLANRFDERTGLPVLHGSGTIDVPSGKLLNLPVFLNLVKVVKLRVPDDTGFEEAHALFYLRGDRIRFGSLDLIGNAVSLAGEGELNLDGSNVQFEFYPVWSKFKEMFVIPGDWTGAISRRFLRIRVTGEIDKLDYRAEPVPGLVEPVKRLMGRLKKESSNR